MVFPDFRRFVEKIEGILEHLRTEDRAPRITHFVSVEMGGKRCDVFKANRLGGKAVRSDLPDDATDIARFGCFLKYGELNFPSAAGMFSFMTLPRPSAELKIIEVQSRGPSDRKMAPNGVTTHQGARA